MTEIYIIEKNNILDVLNDIESFLTKMDQVVDKYPHYKYDIAVKRNHEIINKHKWTVELTITNESKP